MLGLYPPVFGPRLSGINFDVEDPIYTIPFLEVSRTGAHRRTRELRAPKRPLRNGGLFYSKREFSSAPQSVSMLGPANAAQFRATNYGLILRGADVFVTALPNTVESSIREIG